MKISKRHLKKLIKEEYFKLTQEKTDELSRLVREAYAEIQVLNYPKRSLREGLITRNEYLIAQRYNSLNESRSLVPHNISESIGDTIAKVAEKIGAEVGKGASGIAGGLWDSLYGVVKKVGGKAADAAGDTLNYVADHTDEIVAGAGKAIGGTIKGGRSAASSIAKAATDGLDYKAMAKDKPKAFLKVYNGLKKKLEDMGAPVQSAAVAKATLGVFTTPEGQDALAHGAKQAGISPEELKSLMGLFVLQSEYVELATKTAQAEEEKKSGARDSGEKEDDKKDKDVDKKEDVKEVRARLRALRLVEKHTRRR